MRRFVYLGWMILTLWLLAIPGALVSALAPPDFPAPPEFARPILEIRVLDFPGGRHEETEARADAAQEFFVESWEPLSDGVIEIAAHDSFPRGYRVPLATAVRWRVTLTVTNTTGSLLTGASVAETLGPELEVERSTFAVSPAPRAANVDRSASRNRPETVSWLLAPLPPGAVAQLTFVARTRTSEAGRQEYARATGPLEPNWLNSGARFTCEPGSRRVVLPRLPVWVGGDYVQISLAATRLDWQLRKPGAFMTGPFEIQALSNKPLEVCLTGRSSLASEQADAQSTLPAVYQFSADQPGISGWLPATGSAVRRTTSAAEVGGWVTWRLWSRLEVDQSAQAGEYGDAATLTFTVRELAPAIVSRGSAASGPSEREVDL